MQASSEGTDLNFSPDRSLSSGFGNEFMTNVDEFAADFGAKMKLEELEDEKLAKSAVSDEEGKGEEDDDDDNDEDDFTFACVGDDFYPISSDDVLQNEQIKQIFPLFDQSLVFSGDVPHQPPVEKVFVEVEHSSMPQLVGAINGESTGSYCTGTKKALEASREVCKKSNSTGFSKIWRVREMSSRSHSDGRNAFVFLNHDSSTASSSKKSKAESHPAASAKGKKSAVTGDKVKAAKKVTKGKTASSYSSAHELHYLKNKALRDEDRKRSYLPYKPRLVGFFTNVTGGLTKNVHPF